MKFRVHFVEIFVNIPSIKNIPQYQFSVDITKLRVFTETPHRKSELKQFSTKSHIKFSFRKGSANP